MTRLLRVSPIEHDLLSIARAAVGQLPVRAVASILAREVGADDRVALERGLTSDAMRAFEETLARGSSLALLRRGGWRSDPVFAARGALRRGRLWERGPSPLSFSRYSYELCAFLVSWPLGAQAPAPEARAPAGSGDELFAYLVADMLVALGAPLAPLAPFLSAAPLTLLAFADPMLEPRATMASLVAEPMLIEALQPDLARQLLRVEAVKQATTDARVLHDIGRVQEQHLGALVDAAERAERVDLLGFVADAAALLVNADGRHPQLGSSQKLALRTGARASAAGVMRIVERVARLHARARLIGFVDDGYEQAQAFLRAWERYEPALAQAADALHAWTALE